MPANGSTRVDPLPHLLARIDKQPNGCWIWTRATNAHGYGIARLTELGGAILVHRALYQLLVGPVPDDLVMDHLCRNPPCHRQPNGRRRCRACSATWSQNRRELVLSS